MAVSAPDMQWLFEVRQSLIRLYEDEGTSYREQFVPTLLTTMGLSLREEVEDSSPHCGPTVASCDGMGDEVSPMYHCKVAVVASFGFY